MEKMLNARHILSELSQETFESCSKALKEFQSSVNMEFDEHLERAIECAERLILAVDENMSGGAPAGGAHVQQDAEALSKIRHDLRNFIGAVRGYLEMAEEEARENHKDSCAAALTGMIGDLVSLEKHVDNIGKSEASAPDRMAADQTTPASTLAASTDQSAWKEFIQDRTAIKGEILVVDDNEASRNLIATRLLKDGHTVDQALNGNDALQMMMQKRYDIILLDLMMPDINGFEVMQYIRQNDMLRDIRIIVISGLEQEENAIRSISLGAEDYLPKPVNAILLRARIGSCLARKQWRDQEQLYRMHLEAEKSKSEAMLLNTIPASVIQRLSSGERVIADAHENVTVLFSDFVSFTSYAEKRPAQEVVEILNRIFTEFDDISLDLGVEKIKTIGDGYLAVAGLPIARDDHAEIAAEMALRMVETLNAINTRLAINLGIRIGLHTGPVVAGVIGSHKFAYDVWGHTVNTASRHESYGLPQHIHVSAQTATLLKKKFKLTSRGIMNLRGVGEVETFFLLGRNEIPLAPAGDVEKTTIGSVLIVDDDIGTRDFISRRMQKQGWEVEAAVNGQEAWERCCNRRFDLMITDCDMPELDGFELTRNIRKHESIDGNHLRIIAITGSDSGKSAHKCLEAGMDAFLRKPVVWHELDGCINRLFEKQPTGA